MKKIKVMDTINTGSLNAFAEALGVPRTTVAYWRDQDKVPAWRVEAFMAAAEKLGINPAKPQARAQ
jgi:hypothetical protein